MRGRGGLRVRGGGWRGGPQREDGGHDLGAAQGRHRGRTEVAVQQALPGDGAGTQATPAQDPGMLASDWSILSILSSDWSILSILSSDWSGGPGEDQLLPVH